MHAPTTGIHLDDTRWTAVATRDTRADGTFYYSVSTTGVYCRPSCGARLPRPEHVRFHATTADAEAAGFRPCLRCRPQSGSPASEGAPTRTASPLVEDIEARVAQYDWDALANDLDEVGCARLDTLLTPDDCTSLAARYDDGEQFRSHVVMARHGFGRGEYKYFAYPLPSTVGALRTALYPRLTPIANRWNEALGVGVRYPATHVDFLARCHAAGQTRPTPLLLRYGAGDFNALHQDLYGEHVFPLQVAILLSEPGEEFAGGEFVLVEQRPRMQSRAEVVPLRRGDGVIFAVSHRPVRGARGTYRVTMRHGVSRVRAGQRHTAGVIFHDAT